MRSGRTIRMPKSALAKSGVVKGRETAQREVDDRRRMLVATEDLALLREAGVYEYRHPLSDAVAYERPSGDRRRSEG